MARIIIMVAAEENGGIGKDGKIPWHLREDLKRFREYTTNNIVVMGRKTYDSIGHALKDRINVVVTRDDNFSPGDISLKTDDPENVIGLKEIFPDKDIYIIGGSEIYKALWDKADLIYYTRVRARIECDKFVPSVFGGYRLIRTEDFGLMDGNDYPMTFEIWKKIVKKGASELLK